jgi:hypothetical protein
MTRGLLGLLVLGATLTLGYGSVFTLLAEIGAHFGFDDWAIGVIGGPGGARRRADGGAPRRRDSARNRAARGRA